MDIRRSDALPWSDGDDASHCTYSGSWSGLVPNYHWHNRLLRAANHYVHTFLLVQHQVYHAQCGHIYASKGGRKNEKWEMKIKKVKN